MPTKTPRRPNVPSFDARAIGARIGVDWPSAPFDVGDLRKGIIVEMEHQDVTGGDLDTTAKIAWAHLRECPDYYQRLEPVEKACMAADASPNPAPSGTWDERARRFKEWLDTNLRAQGLDRAYINAWKHGDQIDVSRSLVNAMSSMWTDPVTGEFREGYWSIRAGDKWSPKLIEAGERQGLWEAAQGDTEHRYKVLVAEPEERAPVSAVTAYGPGDWAGHHEAMRRAGWIHKAVKEGDIALLSYPNGFETWVKVGPKEGAHHHRVHIERIRGRVPTVFDGDLYVKGSSAETAQLPNPGWGKPYGGTSYITREGTHVWLFRKGQHCRFYDLAGRQIGPEQDNVAPAVAAAMHAGWKDVSDLLVVDGKRNPSKDRSFDYRGFRVEPFEGVSARPSTLASANRGDITGGHRKEHGYLIHIPDGGTKFVSTQKAAREYIDSYMGGGTETPNPAGQAREVRIGGWGHHYTVEVKIGQEWVPLGKAQTQKKYVDSKFRYFTKTDAGRARLEDFIAARMAGKTIEGIDDDSNWWFWTRREKDLREERRRKANKDFQAFQARAKEILIENGAQQIRDNEFLIQSPIGPWHITVYDNWIASRFDNTELASKHLYGVSPINGKLNYHYLERANKEAAERFGDDVRAILGKKNPAGDGGDKRNFAEAVVNYALTDDVYKNPHGVTNLMGRFGLGNESAYRIWETSIDYRGPGAKSRIGFVRKVTNILSKEAETSPTATVTAAQERSAFGVTEAPREAQADFHRPDETYPRIDPSKADMTWGGKAMLPSEIRVGDTVMMKRLRHVSYGTGGRKVIGKGRVNITVEAVYQPAPDGPAHVMKIKVPRHDVAYVARDGQFFVVSDAKQNPAGKKGKAREIEYHLEEIDAWRRGDRGTPGQPSTGQNYCGAMLDKIAEHERELIALGHKPVIDYVKAHGFADGKRGPYKESENPVPGVCPCELPTCQHCLGAGCKRCRKGPPRPKARV